MRYLILLLLFPALSFGQINLKTQARWVGGTGHGVLMTSGTAIDTIKSSVTGDVLTWNGTTFVFSTPSAGGSVDTISEIATQYMLLSKLNKSDSVSISGYATNFKLLSYLTTATAASTYQPLNSHLTTISGLTPANDDFFQYKSGAWSNRTIAQVKSDLGVISSAITTLNSLTNSTQTLATGTNGTDFKITSSGTTHTFDIPDASVINRGLLTPADYAIFMGKQDAITTGTTAQYLRGDLSLATFPTIPTVTPSALTKVDDTNVTLTLGGTPATALLQAVSLTLGWTGTLADVRIASASVWNAKQAALSGTGIVKSTLGTISYLTDNSTNWDAAYTNRISSLTVTGSSGSATLSSNTLNIPTYTLSGLGGVAKADAPAKTLPSTQTTTSTTSFIDITGASLSIAANDSVYVKFKLWIGCSANNGARYAVTIPASATMAIWHAGTSSATVSFAASQWLTTSGTEGSTTNAVANANMTVEFEGWVKTAGTAGTIQIQGRTINAANTLSFLGGFVTSHKLQ